MGVISDAANKRKADAAFAREHQSPVFHGMSKPMKAAQQAAAARGVAAKVAASKPKQPKSKVGTIKRKKS